MASPLAGDSNTSESGVRGDNTSGGQPQLWTPQGEGVLGVSNAGPGVQGVNDAGPGVGGFSARGTGVSGESQAGNAIVGTSQAGFGVLGVSQSGGGVAGQSASSHGVEAISTSSEAVFGQSTSGSGVRGESVSSHGVVGHTDGASAAGVYGENVSGGPITVPGQIGTPGLYGVSDAGPGVGGFSDRGTGVSGQSQNSHAVQGVTFAEHGYGVRGSSVKDHGVVGVSQGAAAGVAGKNDIVAGAGVYGYSARGTGVLGESEEEGNAVVAHALSPRLNWSYAVYAISVNGTGVYGQGGPASFGVAGYSPGWVGVIGVSDTGSGVVGATDAAHFAAVEGSADNGHGVYGHTASAQGAGVVGENTGGGDAGHFMGDVTITGSLQKMGGGFTIDHPLDPDGRYLSHGFVESPEMLNVYSGSVTTDESGEARVDLPGYFEALNTDFRYQLTVQGTFAQAIVDQGVRDNVFTIRTDKPNVHVYWQVTGVRQDPFAVRSPIVVEREKPENERGRFLDPKAYGQPDAKAIRPEIASRLTADSRSLERLRGEPVSEPSMVIS